MSDSYVYFIRPVGAASPVKVGFSEQPIRRLNALMTWSPVPLEIAGRIPGGQELEKTLHECWVRCHSHREWFVPDAKMADEIAKLLSGMPVEQAVDMSRRGQFRKFAWKRPDRLTHLRYVARLRGASVKINRRVNGSGEWPEDVRGIMNRWKTFEGTREPMPPSDEQLARLEEVLSAPDAHYTITWRRTA